MFSYIAQTLPQPQNTCLESLVVLREDISLLFIEGTWGWGRVELVLCLILMKSISSMHFLCMCFQHSLSFSYLNGDSRQCSPMGQCECCSDCLWILQSIIFFFPRGTWSEAIKMTRSAWDWKIYVCGKTLWNSKCILIRIDLAAE